MKLHFYIRFRTQLGQSLWIYGNSSALGEGKMGHALPMNYYNQDFWVLTLELEEGEMPTEISYQYLLKNEKGEWVTEESSDRKIDLSAKKITALAVVDTWNFAGEFENIFFTQPFTEVLLNYKNKASAKITLAKKYTHQFKIKAPLLKENERVCLLGNTDSLGNWDTKAPLFLKKVGNYWLVNLQLSEGDFPIEYKYGVWNDTENQFDRYENEENRQLDFYGSTTAPIIVNDGFIHLANNTWRGAGVAVPVFSLRTKNGCGVGEFTDIKLLVDWSKNIGIKLIQLLPVNDTIATHTWKDSYPYAAISAFALHPLYINVEKVATENFKENLKGYKKAKKKLNDLAEINYEEVMSTKLDSLKEIYEAEGNLTFDTTEYKEFFKKNSHWLLPYSAFSYFRDKYKTSVFSSWKTHSVYNEENIVRIFYSRTAAGRAMKFFCFVQYHLHLQLKEAADYAHKKGIVLKGDIPIGIYRDGCDAWTAPELYNMEWQAGAPPDDFTAIGQNWGFPTYNWQKMKEDDFAWWRQRFNQMSEYFSAFRIDHILGFFRIWSIPLDAVQGILGRFVPCIPVDLKEFTERGVAFDKDRYCSPYITDQILQQTFGYEGKEAIKAQFLEPFEGRWKFKEAYNTQRKIESYFAGLEKSGVNEKIQNSLYDLIANVILLTDDKEPDTKFHFRIGMEKTTSFRDLNYGIQQLLKELYVNYFYRRQDEFWKQEAMQKLPKLKAATNMLVCGEDLGMVPHSVPEVMQQLGILSLEIQRMPKDPQTAFFHPQTAPYLSVVTTSTHDMSTLRGWWEENRERTQEFYNKILGKWGDAPFYCEDWVCKDIILQHLYSPAIWSIFQLQDLFGIKNELRRENPQEERINNPANANHYWRYRIHIPLENLLKQKEFNEELAGYIQQAGR